MSKQESSDIVALRRENAELKDLLLDTNKRLSKIEAGHKKLAFAIERTDSFERSVNDQMFEMDHLYSESRTHDLTVLENTKKIKQDLSRRIDQFGLKFHEHQINVSKEYNKLSKLVTDSINITETRYSKDQKRLDALESLAQSLRDTKAQQYEDMCKEIQLLKKEMDTIRSDGNLNKLTTTLMQNKLSYLGSQIECQKLKGQKKLDSLESSLSELRSDFETLQTAYKPSKDVLHDSTKNLFEFETTKATSPDVTSLTLTAPSQQQTKKFLIVHNFPNYQSGMRAICEMVPLANFHVEDHANKLYEDDIYFILFLELINDIAPVSEKLTQLKQARPDFNIYIMSFTTYMNSALFWGYLKPCTAESRIFTKKSALSSLTEGIIPKSISNSIKSASKKHSLLML